jgi:hypothetical protein
MPVAVAAKGSGSLIRRRTMRKLEQATSQDSEDAATQESDLLYLTEKAFHAMENMVRALSLDRNFSP